MKTADFDFPLPEELIAKEPAPERGGSRLMVFDRDGGNVSHRAFSDLPLYLNTGDILLLNDTRVLPCRLRGTKPNGRELEVLLVRPIGPDAEADVQRWEVLSPGGYTGPLDIAPGVSAMMRGGLEAELHFKGQLRDVLMAHGEMPLPPYLKRRAREDDRKWYQTEYASKDGSIAAPTAGLHFTRPMLEALGKKGVLLRYLTLHVGKGTFMPIRVEEVSQHEMLSEHFEIGRGLLDEIRTRKGRLFTVGTTATRAIEAAISGRYEPVGEPVREGGDEVIRGSTDIFISPGYEFRAVDALLTNFHLPRSTPLMLVSALTGRLELLHAYANAVSENYRFFSYGDAMLVI